VDWTTLYYNCNILVWISKHLDHVFMTAMFIYKQRNWCFSRCPQLVCFMSSIATDQGVVPEMARILTNVRWRWPQTIQEPCDTVIKSSRLLITPIYQMEVTLCIQKKLSQKSASPSTSTQNSSWKWSPWEKSPLTGPLQQIYSFPLSSWHLACVSQ
jgi:hypothetical protein